MSFQDLTGQQFGTITVITLAGRTPVKWQVRCSCGSSWTEPHATFVNGFVPCRNDSHQKQLSAQPTGRLGSTLVNGPSDSRELDAQRLNHERKQQAQILQNEITKLQTQLEKLQRGIV
jgi:hypothetical protein